ncbi:hypothetical protein GCM10019016_062730 [Streptomyces prasinosporus]|uniref:Uncharacterized protein n=1 Tax=Streptomyces prasinosporus TaxID=68256 RepID=A0ABP6TVK3_9ACTN
MFTPLVLGRRVDSGGVLVAALACVLFLTALAAVVDVTLAAGIALGRDVLGASGRADGAASRWSAALTGAVSAVAAVVAADWNLVVVSDALARRLRRRPPRPSCCTPCTGPGSPPAVRCGACGGPPC